MLPKGPRIARNGAMPRWTERGHALGATRRNRLRGLPGLVAALVLLFGAAWLAARLDPLPPRFTGTAHASDGDSFRLGGDRIRLVGLDAPELDQICWHADGASWTCGRAARDHMVALLAAGPAVCEPEGEDRYGRTLARCTVGGSDLGAAMVASGLAIARGAYGGEERAARNAKRGIWQGRFVSPREWRDSGPQDDPGLSPIEQLWIWFRELTGATTLR